MIKWNTPDSTPDIEKGTEKEFWLAVESGYTGKRHVFLAQYQNRPLVVDEEGYPTETWVLESPDDGPIDSVGWVTCKSHYEFDDFYEQIDFDDKYKLLGWAEYTPPEFTGVDA